LLGIFKAIDPKQAIVYQGWVFLFIVILVHGRYKNRVKEVFAETASRGNP